MTFCLGIIVQEGIIGISDSRLTSGNEIISAKNHISHACSVCGRGRDRIDPRTIALFFAEPSFTLILQTSGRPVRSIGTDL